MTDQSDPFAPFDREPFDYNGAGAQEVFSKRKSFTASELQKVYFEPVPFVVSPILARGATLLASKPKKGKSWLALDIALAVAGGASSVCGDFEPTPGDVLFFALEDNARRLQSRLRKLSPPGDWPDRLTFRRVAKLLGDGFREAVHDWASVVERPTLVIVDTFHFIRPPRPKMSYDGDYADSAAMAALAEECGVALLAIHHLRKGASEENIDMVTGTLGVGAGFDSIITLNANPAGGFDLEGRGRDLPEFRLAFDFDATTCRWTSGGDADAARMGETRRQLLDLLDHGTYGPKEAANATGLDLENVKKTMQRMYDAGQIQKTGRGLYTGANATVL